MRQRSSTLKFGLPKCGYCGEESRTQSLPPGGGGKNSRLQKTRMRVCRAGHKFQHKRT